MSAYLGRIATRHPAGSETVFPSRSMTIWYGAGGAGGGELPQGSSERMGAERLLTALLKSDQAVAAPLTAL